MDYREEKDLLGTCRIPQDVYWGIHTYRALSNFKFGSHKTPATLIRALAQVKKACCDTNRELGYLHSDIAVAICNACDEIINGQWLHRQMKNEDPHQKGG